MVVVWFKRDLRLEDHEPLTKALASGEKVLLLYSFESFWTQDPHYSQLHIDFIQEGLEAIQLKLKEYGTKILILSDYIPEILEKIHSQEPITALYSHMEAGMDITYTRDKAVKKWCTKNNILWYEFAQNGLWRALKNRQKWREHWISQMKAPIHTPNFLSGTCYSTKEIDQLITVLKLSPLELNIHQKTGIQIGGSLNGWKYLHSFITKRISGYQKYYSKPLESLSGMGNALYQTSTSICYSKSKTSG
jgi:deoxyribodipyrimidine photo-lyase